MELFAWNVALVLTAYAWIRFCDRVIKPWLEARNDGFSATIEAVNQVRHLEEARESIGYAHDVLTDAERQRTQVAIDRRITEVMERLNRA